MQVTETSSDGLKRELKVVDRPGRAQPALHHAARRGQGPGPAQGLPQGQGAGRAPQEALRPLGDGRGAAAGRRGDEPQGHQGAQRARRAPAQHRPHRGQGRDRAGAVGAERSRLHDVLRGAARDQGHRPGRAEARARGGRRRRRRRSTRPSASWWSAPIRYEVEADRAAGDGDRVTIDFVGRIDGEEFEGGKGEDVQLVVGQSQFIPGFVEGIKGAKAGEERAVNAKFPDDYPREDAGRQGRRLRRQGEGGGQADPARDQRRVRQDAGRGDARQAARSWSAARSPASTPSVARMKLKRQILDALDKAHDFALPRDAGRRTSSRASGSR